MCARALIALPLLLLAPSLAHASGDPAVAALQAELRAKGLYVGSVDGVAGPGTERAVRRAQLRAGIAADGIVGPRTRRALRLRPLGARPLAEGVSGPDVIELQYRLSWHGFPCGTVDGSFGGHTDRALHRSQRWAGLADDGVAGPATVAALDASPPRSPVSLAWPLRRAIADGFGPRGGRFHTGIDIPAATGEGVAAAGPGRVAYAGWLAGGWGLLVAIEHSDGVRTLYAHLSRIDVKVGERVEAGFQIGLVGATGDATGPHLHFEVRLRGAAIDPLTALG